MRHTNSAFTESQLDGLKIEGRNPALSDQTLLRDIQIEQIQRVINGLYFTHFNKPLYDVFSCSD